MIKNTFGTMSTWCWEHWSKVGENYIQRDTWTENNVTTDEGLTHALDVIFSEGANKSWYIALFNDDYSPVASDTYQLPGYAEMTNYVGARPAWEEAGVSSLSISNSANVAAFTMTGSDVVYGAALVSADTPGDSLSGEVLYCASKFTTERTVENDDILKVTVTISAQDV